MADGEAAASQPPSDAQALGAQALDYWEKCQDVAMHFNQLLIRFRTQAIAAFAAAGGLFGFAAHENGPGVRIDVVSLGAVWLATAWAAIALIDFLYYHRLLRGAVEELLRIEEASGVVRLSTRIEEVCTRWHAGVAAALFYAIPFAALGGLTWFAWTYP